VNLPAQAPLSAFNIPANHPTNLFDRAQSAESVIRELQALERDLQQIETPVALTGLQELSTETVQAFATWSSQVIDAIGAPTSDTIAAVQVSRQTALITLETLRQTLAQQQGIMP
jgi:arginine deiminase